MADNDKRAREMYDVVIRALDEIHYHYEQDDEKMKVRFRVSGDDLPMDFVLMVDADRKLLIMHSHFAFKFPEKYRLEGALVTSYANYMLVDGSFDYDCDEGNICYRLTSSYMDSLISPEVVQYMVAVSNHVVDDFNDKFFMVSKGALSVDEFVKTARD